MELYLLDEDFVIITPLDTASSLIWTSKYYDVGDFELHIPDNGTLFPLVSRTRYIYLKDNNSTGINQFTQYKNGECVIKGKMLETLLATRVMNTKYTNKAIAEDIARDVVTNFVISPSDAKRKIPNIVLGERFGLGDIIDYSQRGKHIGDILGDILYPQELSYSLKYNFGENKMYFNVYKGLDRTQGQDVNLWAIFSSEYGNIATDSESYTTTDDYRNFAYVAGQGVGEERIIITVDQTIGDEDIKELWVDAKDMQQEENQSEESYKNQLAVRGKEKLAQYRRTENAEFESNLTDINLASVCSLGDKCTYVNTASNIIAEGRITEIREVWESGSYTKSIILGEEQMTIMQKIKRG